jgi:hypothetical protein
MTAVTNVNSPYELVFSGYHAAHLMILMREYDRAEVLAVRAPELSEKHQFPLFVALARGVLGQALSQLGRASEGASAFIRFHSPSLSRWRLISGSTAVISIRASCHNNGIKE